MRTETLISDSALVAEALAGDAKSFDTLVVRHQVQAVTIANGVTRNMELAKDVAQTSFAKAYFKLKQFKGNSSFKTWLIRIVMNEAKSALRKEKLLSCFRLGASNDAHIDHNTINLEEVASKDAQPRSVAISEEIQLRIEQAVQKLTTREREVFMLRQLEGFSIREVSEILRISEGAVKAHQSQGTKKLRTILEEKEGD
jgi:RNA polymerase sigma-70 factor, ECF subfamily